MLVTIGAPSSAVREASYARRILRGTGVLVTIGATAPFVGTSGTS